MCPIASISQWKRKLELDGFGPNSDPEIKYDML